MCWAKLALQFFVVYIKQAANMQEHRKDCKYSEVYGWNFLKDILMQLGFKKCTEVHIHVNAQKQDS